MCVRVFCLVCWLGPGHVPSASILHSGQQARRPNLRNSSCTRTSLYSQAVAPVQVSLVPGLVALVLEAPLLLGPGLVAPWLVLAPGPLFQQSAKGL